jgi:3-hydroxybutyryl-CoA dehydrogenase
VLPHQHVVVIGGGTMGADIAAIFAAGGYAVDMVQRPGKTRESLGPRLAASIAQLGGATGIVAECDEPAQVPWDRAGLVIESINEDLAAKQKLFARIEELAPHDIPITSNSSSFPISRIAAGLKTARRMLGLHFFMPAHVVPLVEVVLSEATDPAVAGAVSALMTKLGRRTVTVKRDIPGFLANRLQHALMREAWSLIDRGIATPEDVDVAVRFGFGFRYVAAGPVLQKEHSGLDVTLAASTIVFPDLCNDPVPAKVLRDKVAAGEIGMKSGRGFRKWTPEQVAAEKRRYQHALRKAVDILQDERPEGD